MVKHKIEDLPRSESAEIERLLRRLNNLTTRRGRDVLDEFSITPPQFYTLIAIKKNNGITMGELCEYLFLTSATGTGLVDRLVNKGLVNRERGKDDRRVVRIYITTKGEDLLQQAMNARHNRLSRYLEVLTGEEKEKLLELLTRVHSAMVEGMDKSE